MKYILKAKKHFSHLIYIVYQKRIDKITKFYHLHNGESLYLLGDSAEIKFYDLTQFDNLPMICFNHSYLINSIKLRRSKTYGLTVEPYIFMRERIVNKFISKITLMHEYCRKYILRSNLVFFISLSNFFFFRGKNVYNLFLKLPGDSFTKDLLEYNYKFNAGAFQTAISLAIYMGFKKAYVIGVSHHSNSVEHRWYNKGLGKTSLTEYYWNLNTKDRMLFFEIARKYIDIEIITPYQSTSLFFKPISYSEFTGKELLYRENVELVEKEFLDSVNVSKNFRYLDLSPFDVY